MHGDDKAFGLDRGIEGELQLFAGEQNGSAGQIHQAAGVIQVDVGEDDPANFVGIATDKTHKLRERDFGIQLAGKIFEFEAQRKRVIRDLIVEMRGIAGIDEQVAGGMLDENASGGHGEGIAREGAASFDPAGTEIFQGRDGGSDAGMRWSSGQGVSMEIENVGANAGKDSEENEQDSGATQPHTDTRHDQ